MKRREWKYVIDRWHYVEGWSDPPDPRGISCQIELDSIASRLAVEHIFGEKRHSKVLKSSGNESLAERCRIYSRLKRHNLRSYDRVRERRPYKRNELPSLRALFRATRKKYEMVRNQEQETTEFAAAMLEAKKPFEEYSPEEYGETSCGRIYVMAIEGIEAVRIGRTRDLPQRLRRFDWRYPQYPVEIILTGICNARDPTGERAESDVFRLLDKIHLSRHNPDLYRRLETYDWYLPDQRKILKAFRSLTRGKSPLFCSIQPGPLFECFTRVNDTDDEG
jgi:hypothetical protein